MIRLRTSSERGHFDHGWLDTYHTFSFGDYVDREHMGFRSLRVLNEDRVAPSTGFGRHGHRDMEIITYVLSGALKHQDSLGTSAVIVPGEVQKMTAGTGVLHSEVNPSPTDPVHLLQIWIVPDRAGYAPAYEQVTVGPKADDWQLVGSPDGRDGSVTIRQDVSLYVGRVSPGRTLRREIAPGRHAWVQVTRGSVTVNGLALSAGDGAAVSDETSLAFEEPGDADAGAGAEILFFDLA
jgi:quercetin 2,3-dioxygenase